MAFGWWDFGLEIGLVQKGGGGVSRTSENECICGVVMLVKFKLDSQCYVRKGLALTTSVSADMANWVSSSKYSSGI